MKFMGLLCCILACNIVIITSAPVPTLPAITFGAPFVAFNLAEALGLSTGASVAFLPELLASLGIALPTLPAIG